jgi:hypothetical protein
MKFVITTSKYCIHINNTIHKAKNPPNGLQGLQVTFSLAKGTIIHPRAAGGLNIVL